MSSGEDDPDVDPDDADELSHPTALSASDAVSRAVTAAKISVFTDFLEVQGEDVAAAKGEGDYSLLRTACGRIIDEDTLDSIKDAHLLQAVSTEIVRLGGDTPEVVDALLAFCLQLTGDTKYAYRKANQLKTAAKAIEPHNKRWTTWKWPKRLRIVTDRASKEKLNKRLEPANIINVDLLAIICSLRSLLTHAETKGVRAAIFVMCVMGLRMEDVASSEFADPVDDDSLDMVGIDPTIIPPVCMYRHHHVSKKRKADSVVAYIRPFALGLTWPEVAPILKIAQNWASVRSQQSRTNAARLEWDRIMAMGVKTKPHLARAYYPALVAASYGFPLTTINKGAMLIHKDDGTALWYNTVHVDTTLYDSLPTDLQVSMMSFKPTCECGALVPHVDEPRVSIDHEDDEKKRYMCREGPDIKVKLEHGSTIVVKTFNSSVRKPRYHFERIARTISELSKISVGGEHVRPSQYFIMRCAHIGTKHFQSLISIWMETLRASATGAGDTPIRDDREVRSWSQWATFATWLASQECEDDETMSQFIRKRTTPKEKAIKRRRIKKRQEDAALEADAFTETAQPSSSSSSSSRVFRPVSPPPVRHQAPPAAASRRLSPIPLGVYASPADRVLGADQYQGPSRPTPYHHPLEQVALDPFGLPDPLQDLSQYRSREW